MLLVKILGERTDVASYLSYYAKLKLTELLDVKEEDILFEVVVSDYFVDGDLKGYGGIVIDVTVEKKHQAKREEIAKILNSFCAYFETKTWIKFNILEESNSFVFENEGKGMKHKCHCHECDCGEEHECECGCEDDHECHCHDHECECGCGEEHECHCHESEKEEL